MRQIGSIQQEQRAQRFADFLVARKIRNEVEREGGDTWSVWIHDEDRVAEAQEFLARFQTNPDAAEFRSARAQAEEVRRAEAEDLDDYKRRVRGRRSLFPNFSNYGFGVLTYALIFICAVVAAYTKLGHDHDVLRRLFITDPLGTDGTFLPEISSGEVWRLLTPIFIHFGPVHLLFNMLWLFQLGSMIEARRGLFTLAALVVVIGIASNFAQFYFHHPMFGGMSGVVYGLAGFVWMRGKYDRASGVGLDAQSIQWLLIWLVVCYTDWVGPVANTAHLVGLLTGVAWGRTSAFFATRIRR